MDKITRIGLKTVNAAAISANPNITRPFFLAKSQHRFLAQTTVCIQWDIRIRPDERTANINQAPFDTSHPKIICISIQALNGIVRQSIFITWNISEDSYLSRFRIKNIDAAAICSHPNITFILTHTKNNIVTQVRIFRSI